MNKPNEIAFTQYLMPDGRQTPVWTERSAETAATARAVIAAGGRFEIEMLSTGEISMTVEHPDYEADDRRRRRAPALRQWPRRAAYRGIGLHHVHADGRVTSSFYHLHPTEAEEPRPEWRGCGFHEFLELDGWDGGEFLPEPRS